MEAAALLSGAFCLAQIGAAPRWMPDAGMHAFDVEITNLSTKGRALIEAGTLTLADDDLRRWIVSQLNDLVLRASYGTACLELLHGFRVPSPAPAARARR